MDANRNLLENNMQLEVLLGIQTDMLEQLKEIRLMLTKLVEMLDAPVNQVQSNTRPGSNKIVQVKAPPSPFSDEVLQRFADCPRILEWAAQNGVHPDHEEWWWAKVNGVDCCLLCSRNGCKGDLGHEKADGHKNQIKLKGSIISEGRGHSDNLFTQSIVWRLP